MTITNRQVLLAARPRGFPQDSDFELVETELAEPAEGEFLAQSLFLSVDPYMRGRMNDAASYAEPVGIGELMVGQVVARVVKSNHPKFSEGSIVAGMFGWQEYTISDGVGVRRLDEDVAPVSTALNVLGMPGLTAYFGLFDICDLKDGETVVVSGAAGAVGSTVGQLARIKGCRVIGTAGSDEKIDFITNELGFDAGFNYKREEEPGKRLRELCPDGVDVYFDNVGGPITDAVFGFLNVNARVGICGQISQYNATEAPQGPRLLWHLIIKRAMVKGFLVMDFADRFREALPELTEWVVGGQLKYRERITNGLENAPQAFFEMMQGANIGKQLVRVSE